MFESDSPHGTLSRKCGGTGRLGTGNPAAGERHPITWPSGETRDRTVVPETLTPHRQYHHLPSVWKKISDAERTQGLRLGVPSQWNQPLGKLPVVRR